MDVTLTAPPSLTATATLNSIGMGTATPTPPNYFVSTLAVVDCSPTLLWDLSQFTLTPLFADNFDTGVLPIWALPDGGQTLPTENGQALTLSNTNAPAQVMTMDALDNVSVTLKVRLDSGTASILLRQSITNAYRIALFATGEIALWRGDTLICGRAAFTPIVGAWHDVAITDFNGIVNVMIGGVPLLSYTDPDPLPAGGFALQGDANGVVSFDDVEVAQVTTMINPDFTDEADGERLPDDINTTIEYTLDFDNPGPSHVLIDCGDIGRGRNGSKGWECFHVIGDGTTEFMMTFTPNCVVNYVRFDFNASEATNYNHVGYDLRSDQSIWVREVGYWRGTPWATISISPPSTPTFISTFQLLALFNPTGGGSTQFDNIVYGCATPIPTLTPTATRMPRTVEPPAQTFHDKYAQFGLPAPFELWPVTEKDEFQGGYGPNRYSSDGELGACRTPLPPTPTPIAGTATPTPTGTLLPLPTDACQYRSAHGIHSGMDFFTTRTASTPQAVYISPVVALCDGILVPGRTPRTVENGVIIGGGGTVLATSGFGISLRCFANDPIDPDSNGQPNVSNIIVSYNHLTLAQGVSAAQPSSPYQVVVAGEVIGSTSPYTAAASDEPIRAHLHLAVYIADGYRSETRAIHLNPRLMFAHPMARAEFEQGEVYPTPYSPWSLQGVQHGFSPVISYWSSAEAQVLPPFIVNAAGWLEANRFPTHSPYVFPNCINLSAYSPNFGVPAGTPPACILDRNDDGFTATPTS